MIKDYINKLANNKEIYLRIKALPRSGQTEIINRLSDGTLKIALAAAAEKGQANLALIKLLSREFGVERGDIRIISGAGDRLKLVKITSRIKL